MPTSRVQCRTVDTVTDTVTSTFLATIAAWAWGSVPFGAWWIRLASGRDPNALNPRLLGVENVFRWLGPPVAFVGFLLDVVKGAVVVVAAPSTPMVACAVVAGHVIPLPVAKDALAPRGRGNGVLLGALAASTWMGHLPAWVAFVGITAYAVVLAAWMHVTPATLAGLAAVAGLVVVLPGSAAWGPWVALLALLTVRGAPSLARIADGTEPRLGDPPPVRGLSRRRIRAAFMIHPMSVEDLWQVPSQAWMHALHRRGLLPETVLRRWLPHLRPQVHGLLRGVDLPDGRTLEVALIGGPMLPDQIRSEPEVALRMAIQGAQLARAMGAEVFGLGAYWSTVGDKGRLVQEAVPDLPVTHGGTYTAATVHEALPTLLGRFEARGRSLKTARAAIVGANGVVAFGVARVLAGHVGTLVAIGRDAERLERSARTLRRAHPSTTIVTSTDVDDVAGADLIVTATSEPGYVVDGGHVSPHTWVYDLGRPADVDPAVRTVPGVHLIPGGVVRPPGASTSDLDLHFGEGCVPACLAETMILAATGAVDRATTGDTAKAKDLRWFLERGRELGFEVVTDDPSQAWLAAAVDGDAVEREVMA